MSITCDGCGNEAPNNDQQNYPDGGWGLPLDTFGYYGGFDDNIHVAFGDRESRTAVLCHDCVVRFFDTFPLLAERFPIRGGHPNYCHKPDEYPYNPNGLAYPSCCRYCWTWVQESGSVTVYYGDGNGGWVQETEQDLSERIMG